MAGHVWPTKYRWVPDPTKPTGRRKEELKGTTWKARYRDPSGRQRSRTFKRKTDAQKWLQTNAADLHRGEWIDPKLRTDTFAQWADRWYGTTNRRADHTRRGYWQILHNHVLPYFEHWRIVSITWSDVAEFIAFKVDEGRIGPKKIKDCVSVISLVMKHAMRANVRKDNPALQHDIQTDDRPRTEDNVFTMEQLHDLVAATRDPYKPAIWLLAYSGIRPSEFAGLQVRDLDLLRHVLRVREAMVTIQSYDDKPREDVRKKPKTKAGFREITIPAWLCEQIAEMLAARAEARGTPIDRDDPLFVNAVGKPYRAPEFSMRVFKRALREAGLPDHLRLYDLRHTHASLLIAAGADILSVARRMGHSKPSVTLNVYGHLFPDAEDNLTARLEALREAATTAVSPVVVALAPHLGPLSGREKDAVDAKRTRISGKRRSDSDNVGEGKMAGGS